MTDEQVPNPKPSDLKTRIISGIVMAVAAFGLLWLGGIAFLIGVIILGGMVFLEFGQLVDKFARTLAQKLCWKAFGLVYVSAAVWALWFLREGQPDGVDGFTSALSVMAIVWAVDVFAYFTGRAVGGPKIWPAISPSKTWAGLFGGIVGASLVATVVFATESGAQLEPIMIPFIIALGVILAVVAQAGDFFESWMKRRAGVKDSGTVIPGHGGVFDRVDGLLPVVIILALAGKAVLAG